jgi:MFS family permease
VTRPSSWQRNVWALSLSVFIAFVGFQFFSPFLPLYVQELGVRDPAAVALWSGLLAAVTPTVSRLLAPLFGRLADRFGRKMMLIRSLAGFTVIIAAMGLVTSVQQLFAARFLQGLFAGFTPMAMAVASVSAPREKVATAIARVEGAQLLSVAVGPAIGGFAAEHLGIRPAFYVTAALCAVSLVAPTGQLLFLQLVAGGILCGGMALAGSWVSLLVLRVLVALCLGGALTLAYALGGMIVPAEARGAAFGWLAMGVQIGTAASPLLTGALAAATLRGAYFLDGALAWVGALVLLLFARDLLRRRERAEG